jgi:cyclic beta-1,2-glucan synthetase
VVTAPAALARPLADLLNPARGLLAAPIRAEIFGTERFEQHARSLASTHRAKLGGWRAPTFRTRLDDNIAALREAQRCIGASMAEGGDTSPAGEWLLDNFHLIEAQLQQIHEGLPQRYFRSLPLLQEPPLAGLPRVYGVAWAFVAHTDGAFDEDLLVAYLRAYQQTRDLGLGELWALPTTLRIVLVEALRRLAERLATQQAARELARLCGDNLHTYTPEMLDAILESLARRGVGTVFLTQLALQLPPLPLAGEAPALAAARAWLASALPNPAAAQAQDSADQSADNLSVGNAVTALREIDAADWSDIVSRGSALMHRMMQAPAFAADHMLTRGQALQGIEHLARRSGRSELHVASVLLQCMKEAVKPEATTAGHWLDGGGRPAMRRRLGLRAGSVPRQGLAGLALGAYLGLLLLVTGGLVFLAIGAHGPWWLVVLALIPASEAALAVMHRLIGESLRPRPLPRLALAQGIEAAQRVLVVIPSMLSDAATVKGLAHRLLLHHLANVEPNAQFALLTDLPDAATEHTDRDAALLALAVAEVSALNAAPGLAGATPRFLLLHRPRRFSETEQCWIGWERKRGKLEQLVQALVSGEMDAFADLGPLSRPLPGTTYLLTLDADTVLPPGQLRSLVAVAAHPRHRPRLDAAGRRVIAGHGVLQPRIATPLTGRERRTPFHWLFAGQGGIDPYSAASSEVYQDLFGAGSFSGKGLIDVAAMHDVLAGRLPEGQVLSHDLLEGALLRCATVSDVMLMEDAPADAEVAASRAHRWMRGDWQLLPFLVGRGLRRLDRWKMLDNLRRSLLAPASLVLLLVALAGLGGSPLAMLMLVLGAHAAGPLMGALAGLLPDRLDVAARYFYRQGLIDLSRALGTGLWHLAMLGHQALAAVDAIGRTLYRLVVSRRHLLAWTTAAAAGARGRSPLQALLRRQATTPLLALLATVGLLATGTPAPALVVALGLLWASAPLWSWWASRPLPAERPLSVTDRLWLERLAHDTWGLFDRCVGADDNHLPPDNLQFMPHEAIAHRTSPTNIGMYLLSAACARRFGWIGPKALATRLEATLGTLDRLARHRGHFLNWYDTQTLQPLQPMYVSTVDSGNLSGHLLAVAAACRETGVDESPGTTERLHALALRCETLAWAPEFGFLYHRRRHLLHIGYRLGDQTLDTACYDLLASESRLTSLIAIAKGDVPVRHWAALGRPSVAVGATAGLRSWSGSMFEYLMPGLVIDEPPGSVLDQACRAAVAEQQAFGAAQGVPWGVSESAHAGRDHTLAYQYGPQGVPGMALRRTPADELVVAPYATVMAIELAPAAVLANLAKLEKLDARGTLGFIEAIDYSPGRQAPGQSSTRVGTFMAHHQGMSLVALAQVLLDGAPRRWGMTAAPIEALLPLLHERPPRQIARRQPSWGEPPASALPLRTPVLRREVSPGAHALSPTHVLSNGHYSLTLRPNGAGESRWRGRGLSRSRDDALRDEHGSFVFMRRHASAPLVSLTQHPAPDANAAYTSVFHADRVAFDARWPDLAAQLTVWVSPEDDIEFRQVELRNLGSHPLTLTLVSAFEPTLSDARADEAHPAFSNLFLQARWREGPRALVFERRPRLAGEPALWAAHFIAGCDVPLTDVRVQTDRARWRGRHRGMQHPLAELDEPPVHNGPSGVVLDTGLDPMSALAATLRLAPGGKAVLTWATAASDDAAVLTAVIDKYRQPGPVLRASLMSATLADIRLRGLHIGPDTFAAVQTLSTLLMQTLVRPGAAPEDADAVPVAVQVAVPAAVSTAPPAFSARGACDRRLLWRFGISGDRPILLVTVRVTQDTGLLRTLSQALQIWSWGGVACDLIIVNAEPPSYQSPLQQALAGMADPGGGLYRLRADELTLEDSATLQALARVHLMADGSPLSRHVQDLASAHDAAFDRRQDVPGTPVGTRPAPDARQALPAGRFDAETGDFVFAVDARTRPARPWVNVLAQPGFGALLSESGSGMSWAHNSRMHQITAWSNDPVADTPAEWFLLQDERTRDAWSLAPSAWGDADATYTVRHGQGESSIEHRHGDLAVRVAWCVDADAAVKHVSVEMVNHGTRTRSLRLAGMAEWMMGTRRGDRATVRTAQAAVGRARVLMATQDERGAGFGGATAFLALSEAADDWTTDRREFFDTRGRLVLPDHLGRRFGGGLDPCAAIATRVSLAPGASARRVFLLGHADTAADALALTARALALPPAERTATARARWDALLGATTVKTPDPLFDVLVNRWLLYQAVACRLWAKAGFYQAGGATGFRDQLQDTMSLAWAAPAMLRAQIVLCASRQFAAGDVQHWWHAPQGAGVRTHVSDDLLWLPLAVAQHQEATGDASLLDERVPFLEGAEVPAGAEDIYETPVPGTDVASVYEHAARAIDHSLRVGQHGLPLMGSGDWNDGMNRVGHEGRGESVWLGWFLCSVVAAFAPLARARGDADRADRWEASAVGWRAALESEGWDGQWYRRAFFDDGTALGSRASTEARIDLIAQAWSVLSDVAPPARQRAAMQAAEALLVDPTGGLLRLLDPPLNRAEPAAGYIQAYPAGVRENGGQYAHAAVWALMARARLAAGPHAKPGDRDAVYRWFGFLSPAHRTAHPVHGRVYGLEPYVMAGDICTQAPHVGRGGWSWYTGAAGWLHRAAVESVFGLKLSVRSLHFEPCLPTHWPRAELTLRRDGRRMHFCFVQGDGTGDAMDAPDSRPLAVGEALDWTVLGPDSHFTVRVPAERR